MLLGEPNVVLPDFVKSENIGGIIADFTPLRKPIKWLNDVMDKLPKNVPVCQVGLWKSLVLLFYAVSFLTWLHNAMFYLLTDVQGCNNYYFIMCMGACQILIKITKRALIYKSKHNTWLWTYSLCVWVVSYVWFTVTVFVCLTIRVGEIFNACMYSLS